MVLAIHELHAELIALGICGVDSLEPFGDRVRDRDDVSALRCSRSGVVVLSSLDHIDAAYYPDKEHNELAALGDRDRVAMAHNEDTVRRADQYTESITNKRWLDIGCGSGAMLDRLASRALEASGVEPQGEFQAALRSRGFNVHRDIVDVPDASIDIATLFHVFEHIPTPLAHLSQIRRCVTPGGKVVIEVPHARDFLLSFLEVEDFKNFTLWSEHLLLHTRESLRRYLTHAGFTEITIRGFQRYPLANHLYWLTEGKPGGHQRWSMLRGDDLDSAYGAMLSTHDMTDTLIAEARVPA